MRKRRRHFPLSRAVLLTAAFLVPTAFAQTAPATNALPAGGRVVAGQVSLTTSGPAFSPTLNVAQGSDRAIVNWQTFDVGRDATVRFAQPSASSATLNRVVGTDPSRIFGRVEANGQVFLVNPQGVYFSPTSSVDVGSFVASTLSIADADFLAGRLGFRRDGATGSVVNEGSIRSALGGYVALLAPEVRNAGLIMASAGTVVLAAGEAVSFNFDPAAGVAGLLVEPARVQALVDNARIVRAPGGQVIVSAQAHNELAAGVIRNTGEVSATGIAQDGGRIFLGASTAVEQGGVVDASAAAGKGGDVTLVAPSVSLSAASSLLAVGELGGGRIRVGGDWQGKGLLPQSRLVTMAAGALVDASARRLGDGGEVVLWSDVHDLASRTQVAGDILARGGESGGDGGRVETSGRVLDVGSLRVDTRSPLGLTGDWLLDPVNITIAASGGNLTPAQLRDGLLTSNVTISTAGSGSATGVSPTYSAGLGDITISSQVESLSPNSLTLTADNNIVVNAIVAMGGALTLNAGNTISLGANVITGGDQTYNGAVNLTAGVSLDSSGWNVSGYTWQASYGALNARFGGTSATFRVVGGTGGQGGTDTLVGLAGGASGDYTATVALSGITTAVIQAGTGGSGGSNNVSGTGGGAGGTGMAGYQGGAGGAAGASGSSGGGGGGGAASVVTILGGTLVGGGGGGGAGANNVSGNPGTAGQGATAQVASGNAGGAGGYGGTPLPDGGGSGGGGGGILGGQGGVGVNASTETSGRGGYAGTSGASGMTVTGAVTTTYAAPAANAAGAAAAAGYNGFVAITGKLVASATPGNIVFGSTINGAQSLTLTSGSGTVTFGGNVGGATPLGTLNVTGAGASFGSGTGSRTLLTGASQSWNAPLVFDSKSLVLETRGAAGSSFGIDLNQGITKASGGDITVDVRAHRDIYLGGAFSPATGKVDLKVEADYENSGSAVTHDGVGFIQVASSLSTNGGYLKFGSGSTASVNGSTVLVGGDVYVTGSSLATFNTGGGAFEVQGELLIGNASGLTVQTGGGSATFAGAIDAGNTYASVVTNVTWDSAKTAAASGTQGAVGSTYLATITSRLENMIAIRAANYDTAWLGGKRVTGIGTNQVWRWVVGPEGLLDSGKGLQFFTENYTGSGGTAISGAYTNWNTGEPNNSGGANTDTASEPMLQFTGVNGTWNDLSSTSTTPNRYVKETLLGAAPLTVNAGAGAVTFSGAIGQKKALGDTSVTGGAITFGAATNVGSNVLTVNAGTSTTATAGAVTAASLVLQGAGSHTFTNAGNNVATLAAGTVAQPVGGINYFDADTLSVGTVGSVVGVRAGGAVTIAAAGDLTVSSAVTGTGAGAGVVFKSATNVLQNASLTVQTNGGDIVYWSDTGGVGSGNRGILISDSTILDSRTNADRTASTHTTGGGMIVLGGGSTTATSAKGTTIPTGYAINYTGVPSGLMVGSYNSAVGHNANVRMYSGGGDVVWRGKSTQNVISLTIGISAFEGVVVNAGTTGGITLDGVAAGNTTAAGMDISGWRASAASSSFLTVDGNILFTSSGTGATTNVGTQLSSSAGYPITLAATGAGTVTLKGLASGTSMDINLTDVQLLSGTGSVTVAVERAGGKLTMSGTSMTTKVGQAAGSVVTSSSASVLLKADVFDVTSTNGLAINTTGTVELTSYNATAFTAAPGFSRLDVGGAVSSAANSIGSFTLGKTTNTSTISLATGSVNAQGPIRVYGSDFTIGIPLRTDATSAEILLQATGFLKTSANLTTTGATSPIRLLAGNYFNVTAASTWTTSGSDILVSANTDGTGGGYIYGSGNQTIVTSGGAVTFAGGNATGSGYAEGLSGFAEGIRFFNALSIDTSVKTNGVSTGGGNISLRGRSATAANAGWGAWGVGVDGVTTFDAGTGTIRIDGVSATSSGDSYNMGVRFASNASMTSASTSATAIYVTGTGGSAASSYSGGQGIRFEGSGNLLATTGVSGGIKLSGTGGSQAWAVVFQGGSILSSSGPIELSGTAANSYVYLQNVPTIGFKAGTPVTASTANILLSFFDADWGGTSAPVIATSGSFTFRPSGASFNRVVSTSWFNLPTTLSGLTLGSATNTSGIYLDTNQTVLGPVTLQGGYVYVYNTLSAAGDVLFDGDTGANIAASIYGVYVNAAVSTTAASNGSITLTGRGGNNNSNYGVYMTTSGSLTAGGSGSISVTGIGGANAGAYNHGIIAYSNLTTSSGSITLNGTGGGTSGSSTNKGIYFYYGPIIKTTTGALTIIGTGGIGASSEGLNFADVVTLGAAGQSGAITLRSDSFLFGSSNVNILGTGNFTAEPLGASFTAALSTGSFPLPSTLASVTLGKAGNTGDITVANAVSTAGAITITGGAVALNGALTSTGGNIGITDVTLTGASGISIPTGKTLTVTQSGASTYDGAISGAGGLTKAGAGTLSLSASSGFTGATSVSAGTLSLGGGGTSGWLTGTSSIAVDGTLQIWRSDDVAVSLPLTGAGTVEVKGAYRALFSSNLTTTAQTIASNMTVAEVLRRLSGGQLNGTSTGGAKEAAAYQVSFDPVANIGRFQLQYYDGGYTKTVFVRLVQNGANVQALVDQVSPYTNGTGYVVPNALGQDMATYSGVNYTMPLATTSGGSGYGVGRLDIAGKTTLSNLGSFAGTLKLTAGTETGPTGDLYSKTIPGVLEVTSGFGSVTGIVNNGLLYLNQSADTTLPNTVSGTGGLIKLGAGNTTFSADASFTGETTVVTGRLTLQGAYGSSVHTILSGATLALDTAVDRDYASTTFRGTGTLVKSGAGRALWSTSVATFALGSGGMIDVQGGIFTGSSNSNEVWTNNYADLNVASGARFAAVEGAVRVDALTGSGDITVGYAGGLGSLTVGVDNHTAGAFSTAGLATFSGVIADTGASATGAVTKVGTGTQVFGGANTYSRVTTISAGTLAITDAAGLGATAAGTTIASGATLDLRGVVVGAESLTVNGGTVLVSTGTSSLSGTVTLGASGTVAVDGTQLTLGGVISGATFGLTKTGNGLAILTGVNTFSGDVAVNGGTLRVGGAGSLGSGTYVGAITVASGATSEFASSANQILGTAVSSGNTTNASSNTLRGAGGFLFSGTGAITLRGDFSATGTVALAQAVTMTGGTNNSSAGLGLTSGIEIKNGGTITLGGGANSFIGSSPTSILTIRAGGKLTTDGTSGQTFHLGNITLDGGELATGASATTTVWGLYNLDKTITVTADSTLSAQFNATYQTGGTVFNVASGKTLTVSGTFVSPSSTADNGLVVNSAAGSTGTMLLTGVNSYTGATTITRGTLKVGGAGSLGSGSYAGAITDNGALEFGTSVAQAISGVISGAGTLTQSGAGTTTLTATNTYTGATTISAGVLQVGNGGTTGALSSSTAASIASGATLRYYRADVFPASITIAHAVSGDGLFELKSTGGNGTGQFKLTGANTLSSSAVIQLNQARLIAETQADISANLPLVRVMSGGQLYINRTGTIGNPLELGAGLGWKETDGTQLGILHVPAWSAAGAVTFTGNVTLTGGSSIAAWANSADVTMSGVISDGGNGYGFTKLGTLKVTLTGANTFTGSTTISAGTLQVGASGTTGVIGGAIVNNSALIFDRSDNLTFANGISGTGTLTKAGANTLTLTGANTYSGATTVTAGGIVFRRDTAPSTSGFAGAGTVTLESVGAAFTSAVVSYTYASTITGLTIGKPTNSSSVTLGSAVSIAGPVTVYGGNIAVNAAVSATGDLILDGDTGAQLSGNFTGLAIGANLSTTAGSNGNITLRGRGGDNSAGGQHGITIASGVTVSAGGTGAVLLEGFGGASAGATNSGVTSTGTITTGSGNLTITGVAGGTGASSNNDGVALNGGSVVRAVGGAVLLDGIFGVGSNSESLAFDTTTAITLGQSSQTGATTLRGDVQWVGTNNLSLLGSGAVTIEPKGTSFASALSTAKFAIPATASAFTFGKAGNTAALTVASNIAVAGPATVYGGDVTFSGGLAASAAGDILVRSSGVLTVAASKLLSTANGSITLTASRFVNNGGSGALSAAGTGKTWQVWSTNADPYNATTGDVTGGLAFDFRQYDASYGITTAQGTGKGLFYGYAPTLTASYSSALDKVYDRTATATITNAMVTASGYAGTDTAATFTFSAATYASRVVGSGQAITFVSAPTVVAQSSVATGSKPVYGYRYAGLGSPTGSITALALNVTGVTAANKVYDRQLGAVISGGSISPISGDTVTLDNSAAAGAFATKTVANGKAVTVTGFAISGADAGNYALVQPTGVTANITALSLNITGVTAANKVYDRQLGATVSGGSISPISGDTVSLVTTGRAGVFADKLVGTGKAVTVTGYAISGADAANYALVQPTGVTADITALSLAVTGVTAANKVYDRQLGAVISGGAISPISGDVVTLDASGRAGVFATKTVGVGKSVTVTGYAISGADAANYALVQPTGVTADITALSLAVTGVTAANKVYDRQLGATVSGGSISPISGDTVTLDISGRTGAFATKTVGTGKAVTVSGYTISGADAGNYALIQPTGVAADITTLTLNVTGVTAANKVYDRQLGATVSGGSISPISGDTVTLDISGRTGAFATKTVGAGKAVTVSGYVISGADAANYALVQPTGVTADITVLSLNVTGVTAANKVYDRQLGAVISGGSISPISGDTVTLDNSAAAGAFATKTVANGKAVTVTGFAISGADAGNYALVQPTGVTANITALSLNITGVTAANKVYDRQLGATVSGGSISPISGDVVILDGASAAGSFATKTVGTGKAVTVSGYVITGADAGNYALVQPTGVTADITALSLSISGLAPSRAYDRTLTASLSGATVAALAGDAVTLDVSGASGAYADKAVGTGKAVTYSGFALAGADASNYSLVQPTGVTGDITAAALAVTGVTAANKIYDRQLGAVISGGVISPISGDAVTLDVSGRAGVFATKTVGTGKSVTVTGYTISGADAANYALVQPTGVTADITALSLAVTGATAANKVYDRLLGATVSGGSISPISGDAVTLVTAGRTGAFADKNVGTGKAVTVSGYAISGADAANYVLVQPDGVTADITALALNVTGVTAANKVYDRQLGATVSGGSISPISGDAVTLDISGRTGAFAATAVGAGKAVTVAGYAISGADAGNYALAQPTGVTADITPATLAVTGVTAASKVYDHLLTTTVSGGSIAPFSGDTVILDTSGRAGAFVSKTVGTGKAVTVTGYAISGADAGNYTLAQPTGVTADITALSLNVTGVTAANKVYDRQLGATVSGGSISPISGDAVTLDGASAVGSFATKTVGTGKGVTVTGYALSGADAGNYVLVQPTGVTADITALSLAVTGATASNKVYDRQLGATVSGGSISPISGDAVTLDTSGRTGAFADKNVGTGKSVAVSGYVISGADAGNYALVQPTGVTADITALSLSVTGVTAANKVYDRQLGATVSGGSISPISGDAVTLDISGRTGAFATKNVGAGKSVTVSGYAISGADAGNYSLVQPTGVTADITALSLAVTGATAANKTYDRLLTATISGGSIAPISGDAVTLDASGRSGAFADKNVGAGKSVTVSGYAISGADAGNYTLIQPTGVTADITALSLAVTGATAASKTYDRLVAATISGGAISPISGDAVTLDTSGRTGTFADKTVGTGKSVTVSGYAISGADAGNYSLVQPTGVTADITALSLAVFGVTAANKVYDRLLTATISGGSVVPISGDAVTLDASGRSGVFADKNVGMGKSVTVSGYAISGVDAGNYALVQPAGVTADITALSLAVTGTTAANKVYDRQLGAAVSGGSISPISGDVVTLDGSVAAGSFATKNVGTGKAVTVSGYAISGADAGNYALVQPTGVTADITALSLAVTGATAANKVYDRSLAAMVSGGSIAPISGDAVTLDVSGRSGVFADKNVGTGKSVTVSGYAIAGADAGNYALVQPTGVTADITALSLAVTGATAANKVYDHQLGAVISGGAISPISGDTVTLDDSGRSGVFADKNVGTGKSVTVFGYAIAGADAGNYALVQPTGVTADISALSLAVTGATAANKVYDRLLTATVSGGSITPIAGDIVTLDDSGRAGVFADKNVGTSKAVMVSGYAISGADAGNYSLVQPTGVTADITALSLAVTGATAANKTYDRLVAATVSGGAISPISGDAVTLDASGRTGTFADKNVGTGKSVTVSGYAISGADAGNYSLVQPTGVTADITALSLAVTGATAANKVYDRLLTATVSGGSIATISGDAVTLDDSGRSGVFADKNVGTGKSVTISGYAIAGADAGNYALIQPTGVTADITALSLAVNGATAANKTYDRTAAATISGGSIAPIAGDIVTLDDSGRSGVFADKNVGTSKAVTVSGYAIVGADAGNYALVQPIGVTADITALSLSVTGVTAANKVYDRQLGATVSGGSIAPIAGDAVTLDDSGRSGVFADKNVGTSKAVTVSGYAIVGADAGNYALIQPTGVTADITALSLAITGATTANKTYDRLLGATISGGSIAPIAGDIVTLDDSGRSGVFADKNVGTGKSVTISGYAIAGADAGNYALIQPTGLTADITPLSLAVTGATAANKTYDRTTAATVSGGSIAPIVGDVITLDDLSRSGVFADKNVGTNKAVTVSGYAISGADAGNYSLIQPVGVTADITPLSLAVTGATATNKVYDRLLTATVSGGSVAPIAGDTVILDNSARSGVFADKNAGTGKAVTVSGYVISGADAGNYSLVQPAGVTADITVLSLAVTGASATSKTYDRTVAAALSGGTVTPIAGDDVALDATSASGVFADKNVGMSKAVSASGYALAGADAANYVVVQPSGLTADISPLALQVFGASAASKTYDRSVIAAISGGSIAPIPGDIVTLDVSGRSGVFADKNVGVSKPVTVSGYAISGADAGNYVLVQPTGVMADITPLSLAVTGATATNKVYDRLLAATVSGGSVAPIAGDTVILDNSARSGVFADKNVGTGKSVMVTGYAITGADARNYALVQPTGLNADITPLALQVLGVTAANKLRNGSLVAELSGGSVIPLAGDSVTLDASAALGLFLDDMIGMGKPVSVSGFALTGADAGNYAIVQPTGVVANINDPGVAYPPLTAPPAPAFTGPSETVWAPPIVLVTMQGPAESTPQLVVSALSMPSSAPDHVPVGSMLTLSMPQATPVTEVSVEIVGGFVAGDTVMQINAPEGLKVSVDNATGKVTISGEGSPAAYDKVLKSLAVSSSGGNRVGGLTLSIGVSGAQGGKSTTTVKLQQGGNSTAAR